jgi:hypothetical protein
MDGGAVAAAPPPPPPPAAAAAMAPIERIGSAYVELYLLVPFVPGLLSRARVQLCVDLKRLAVCFGL